MIKIGYNKNGDLLNIVETGGKNHISSDRFKFAILEKVDDIVFGRFVADEKIEFPRNNEMREVLVNDFSAWDKGRLFGEYTELKWLKRNNEFHIVVITEEDDLPQDITPHSFKNAEKMEEHSIYLWGEKDETIPGFYDAQIPQILEYPVVDFDGANSRLKLKIQEYGITETAPTGEAFDSIIHRYVDLEE